MPDPFSISLGVVALLQLTYSAGNSLRKFINDAAVVDITLENLENEINGLARVLESMRVTFEKIEVEEDTGHVAAHWRNIAQSLEDGKGVLRQLEDQILSIGEESNFLSGFRRQHRLNTHKNRIAVFRLQIQSYRDGLQLSMQTIILWNQVSQQNTDSQVIPLLNDLQNEVRRIALDMNQRIETLEALAVSEQDQNQVDAMENLRHCVQSAASLVSSASTIVLTTAENEATAVMLTSDFGDCFPVERKFAMQRWIQTRTVTATEDPEPQAAPGSMIDIADDGDDNDDEGSSDSEADLDYQLRSALLENAQQKMQEGDLDVAERLFRNCLSRLSALQAAKPSSKIASSYLDVTESLLQLYTQQKNWTEAQSVLQRRLASRKHKVGSEDTNYLGDVLRLARTIYSGGNMAEAQLQARRALNGYMRLEDSENVQKCLVLLIDLSKSDGNENDAEAYAVLLGDAKKQETRKVKSVPLTHYASETAATQKTEDQETSKNASSVGAVDMSKDTEQIPDASDSSVTAIEPDHRAGIPPQDTSLPKSRSVGLEHSTKKTKSKAVDEASTGIAVPSTVQGIPPSEGPVSGQARSKTKANKSGDLGTGFAFRANGVKRPGVERRESESSLDTSFPTRTRTLPDRRDGPRRRTGLVQTLGVMAGVAGGLAALSMKRSPVERRAPSIASTYYSMDSEDDRVRIEALNDSELSSDYYTSDSSEDRMRESELEQQRERAGPGILGKTRKFFKKSRSKRPSRDKPREYTDSDRALQNLRELGTRTNWTRSWLSKTDMSLPPPPPPSASGSVYSSRTRSSSR